MPYIPQGTGGDTNVNDYGNAFDPIDHINITRGDLSEEPGALPVSTYFPTQAMNPATVSFMPGRYAKALPVFSGGQLLYPYGVRDARRKAIADSMLRDALRTENEKSNLLSHYAMIKSGVPAYQDMFIQKYGEQIAPVLRDIYDTYGTKKGNEILDDPNNPITMEKMIKPYMELEGLNGVITDINSTLSKIEENRTKNGEVYSDATNGEVMRFLSGQITNPEDFYKLRQNLRTYTTLDSAYKDKVWGDMRAVDSAYENGIDVMKNGKTVHLDRANGTDFINAVKTKAMSPEVLSEGVNEIMRNPNITPDQKDPKMIADYIKAHAPSEIDAKLEQIKQERASGSGDVTGGMPNTADTEIFRTPFIDPKGNTGISNTTGTEGFKMPPKHITVSNLDLHQNNPDADERYDTDITGGYFAGAYKFPVNERGKIVPDVSAHKSGEKYFAVVQVPEKGTTQHFNDDGTISDAVPAAVKTFYVPFDLGIRQQVFKKADAINNPKWDSGTSSVAATTTDINTKAKQLLDSKGLASDDASVTTFLKNNPHFK